MNIHRDHVLHPITSAEVVHSGLDRILLAGEGPFVKLFSLTSSSSCLLQAIQVFQTQTIHGISHFTLPSSHATKNILLALWGGRSLALVRMQIRQDSDRIRIENVIIEGKRQLDDWILNVKFVDDSQEPHSSLVLLDAQNNLLSLRFPSTSIDERPFLMAQGPPSALYCGDIRVKSPDEILVASGTVFGGVHLWSASAVNDDATSGQLLAVYAGHEGSVFGIHLTGLGLQDNLQWVILTCSDDRTIKIWNAGNGLQKNPSNTFIQDIDTGFAKNNPNSLLEASIASGTGHASRIWRIVAIAGTGHPLTIISFGEDATAQFWSLQGKIGVDSLSLTKGRSLKIHSGKSIWAAAAIPDEDQTNSQSRIATGGADGRIVVSNVDLPYSQTGWSSRSPEIENFMKAETFGSYCWLDSSRLLVVTATGSVFLGDVEHRPQAPAVLWTRIIELAELSRHALLAAPGPNHAIIAGSAGHVYLFTLRERKVELLGQVSCNISFLSALYSRGKGPTQRVSIFIANKSISKLHFGVVNLYGNGDIAKDNVFHEISLVSGFTITAAVYLHSNILALGSRGGAVAIYRVNDDSTFHQLINMNKVHQKETVTSITALGSREWMLTTGRDGHFRIYKIRYSDDTATASLVHSGILPFGPDIEGAGIIDGKLQIWGFRAQELVLWNHGLQQELVSIDCSGRHRNWSFSHGTASALAWTCAGVAHIASFRPNSVLLQQGTHGREIKALAIRSSQDTLGHIIATGSEDTCIYLSRYDNKATYQTREIIRTHITGLQKLAWSSNGRFLLSAAGKEEFLIWDVQPVPVVDVGIKLVSRCPPITRTQILRIMDFDFIETSETYTILMVYSDSSIRVWHFDIQTTSWELLHEITYGSCCITQCKMIDQYFLTASTDGSLVLWSAADLTKISQQQIHQSSIKCLEVMVQDDHIVIATGGDDGMLALCVLDRYSLSDASPSVSIDWHTLLIPRAHAAAFNALTFIQQPALSKQLDLVSVSNDQVIKTWTVSVTRQDKHWHLDIPRHGKHASSIADASCVQAFTEDGINRIIVAGIGLEFWKGG